MRNTGIVRRFDALGRIGIPKEIRDRFDIHEKSPVSISVKDSNIIIEKVEDTCILCDSTQNLCSFNNKFICNDCISKISKLN